ncbi:MAG: hypothetical protein LC799_30995, partial [Actinobacteria bacterium]|nr:hypothetical protein [Actinomycetota bacterium]
MVGERRVDARPDPGVADDCCTSKIGVPALPEWLIPRTRLTTRIDKGSRGALTVVTGAPGAGKTVAVASWVASRTGAVAERGPLAWVTGDDGDVDPDLFWSSLQEALRRTGIEPPPTGSSPLRDKRIDHVCIAELASV